MQAFADLGVTISAAPNPVLVSSNLTWTATVTNLGPDGNDRRSLDRPLATGHRVRLGEHLARDLHPDRRNGDLFSRHPSNQTGAVASIVVTPTAEGILTNIATVSSDGTGTNPANNVATAICTVQGVSALSVAPTSIFAIAGPIGGPLSPPAQVYSLTDIGTSALAWSANASQSWLTLSVTSGNLLVGQGTNVTASISSIANTLPVGSYSNTVTFANLTNGNGTTNLLVTLTVNPLPAPSNLSAVAVTNGQVNLSWTDNSNGEDSFEIDRAPDNGGTPGTWAQIGTVTNNVTTYSDFGLNSSTPYWYRVRAFNSLADSDYSDPVVVTTLPLPPPAPSGPTAMPLSGSQIALSWTDNSTTRPGSPSNARPTPGAIREHTPKSPPSTPTSSPTRMPA